MSFSNVARSTAAGIGRRSRSRPLLSAVASTSANPSTSSSPPSRRSQSTDVLSTVGDSSDVPDEPLAALPPVARTDPFLYHALLPTPESTLASILARFDLSPTDDEALAQLRIALTHPSWVELRNATLDDEKNRTRLGEGMSEELESTRAGAVQSNAALATVGNSLLGMLASEYLHLQYPNLPTRVFKAALSSHVGPGTLVDVAVELGLGAKGVAKWDTKTMIPRSRGELRQASSKDILAQAMRACVGLVFQTKGLAATRHFVNSHFLSRMPLPPTDFGPTTSSASATSSHPLASLLKFNNPKRSLSMTLQKYGLERPQSRLIAETGRLTQSPVFGVGVYSGTQKVGEGWGSAIRMAEYRAAEDALRRLYLRKSAPLAADEIPSSTLDAELAGAAVSGGEVISPASSSSSSPSSVGKDIWAVGAATSTLTASSSLPRFRPRDLGESEIVFDNKG